MMAMIALLDSIGLLAQGDPPSGMQLLLQHLLAAVVFSFVGVIVFFASLWLMEKLTPFSIIQEVTEEHNMALALIVGMIVLGMAVIIAAAILG